MNDSNGMLHMSLIAQLDDVLCDGTLIVGDDAPSTTTAAAVALPLPLTVDFDADELSSDLLGVAARAPPPNISDDETYAYVNDDGGVTDELSLDDDNDDDDDDAALPFGIGSGAETGINGGALSFVVRSTDVARYVVTVDDDVVVVGGGGVAFVVVMSRSTGIVNEGDGCARGGVTVEGDSRLNGVDCSEDVTADVAVSGIVDLVWLVVDVVVVFVIAVVVLVDDVAVVVVVVVVT
jgi:hypothetical protein